MRRQSSKPLSGARFTLKQLQHVGRLKKEAAFADKRRMQRRKSIDVKKAMSALIAQQSTKKAGGHINLTNAKHQGKAEGDIARHEGGAKPPFGEIEFERVLEHTQQDCRM